MFTQTGETGRQAAKTKQPPLPLASQLAAETAASAEATASKLANNFTAYYLHHLNHLSLSLKQ